MTDVTSQGRWTCRPDLYVSRMLGFALAMLIVLIAVFLFFRALNVFWLLLALPVALWVGFKGAPLLLRGLSRAGVFGRVRIEGERLVVGRGSRTVALDRPFAIDARQQHSRIVRETDLRRAGVTSVKTVRRGVTHLRVLTVQVTQDERRHLLLADQTDRDAGPPYDPDALRARPHPIERTAHPAARLWIAELAAVLDALRAAPGYEAPVLDVQAKPREDPRRLFAPPWKLTVGAVAILVAFLAGSLWAYQGHAARVDETRRAVETAAKEDKAVAEARAQALVGQRVTVEARGANRLLCRVESYEMRSTYAYEPVLHDRWEARLTVVVEEVVGADGRPLADEARVLHRFTDDEVARGDRLEVDLDELAADAETPP